MKQEIRLREPWERAHTDSAGDVWRSRFDELASNGGFFGIVFPGMCTSGILLGPTEAKELRDRINFYLGTAS